MQTEVLSVRSLTGQSNVDRVTATLKSIPGVCEVIVSLSGNSAAVHFDEKITSTQELQSKLACAGYAISRISSDNSYGGKCCGKCG
jgi:copper chaperone CopZ